MKINYVIATWDGKNWCGTESHMSTRFILDQIGKPKADEVLALHLDYLSKLKHSLAQITIMKPTEHNEPKYDNYYKNAEQVLKEVKFSCPVVTIESDHYKEYSYGQWLHAYELFRDQFDYYIFVEDDTVAAIPYFDTLLTTLFQHRIPNHLGYLCTKSLLLNDDYYKQWDSKLLTINHMSISTGITNSKTLSLVFQTYGDVYDRLQHQLNGYVGITNHPFKHGHLVQMNFSLLFTHNNLCEIRDYSNMFSCPFWMRDSISSERHMYKEFASGQFAMEPLIMPVTMIVDKDEKTGESSVRKMNLLATLGFLEDGVAKKRMELIALNSENVQLDLSNQHLNNNFIPIVINKQIQELNLSGNVVSDPIVPFLMTLPLRRLNLDDTHISDDGLVSLLKHPTLEYISVVGSHVMAQEHCVSKIKIQI